MSNTSPLKARLGVRLREAFGDPSNLLRHDHWSLQPRIGLPTINVLIEDAVPPAVWVFDPTDKDGGVRRECIRHEEQIQPLIEQIQQRVERIAHFTPKPG